MTRFEAYCQWQRVRYGDKFIPPGGAALIAAFNCGPDYRVKVETTYASGSKHTRWGYVELTDGWQPAFILMRRRGQIGSSDLLDADDKITAYKWVRS